MGPPPFLLSGVGGAPSSRLTQADLQLNLSEVQRPGRLAGRPRNLWFPLLTRVYLMYYRRSIQAIPKTACAALLCLSLAPALGLGILKLSAQARRAPAQEAVAPSLFQGLTYRMVGPSRGGRVTAVAGHRSHPHTFYMGATGGGVWKTTTTEPAGYPISDGYFATGSIGAIRVARFRPEVVYVGPVRTDSGATSSSARASTGPLMPARPGTRGPRGTWGTSAPWRSTRATRHRVYVAAIGNPSRQEPGTWRLPHHGRGTGAGRRSSSSRTAWAPSTWSSTLPTPTRSTPPCGVPSGSRGPSSAGWRRRDEDGI